MKITISLLAVVLVLVLGFVGPKVKLTKPAKKASTPSITTAVLKQPDVQLLLELSNLKSNVKILEKEVKIAKHDSMFTDVDTLTIR